jgi:HEAT repeat protein
VGPTVVTAAARRRAAARAGHTGDLAGANALAGDPDPGVRATAVGALARLGALNPDMAGQLVDDPDPGVRRRLANELGRMGGPGADGQADPGADGQADPDVATWAAPLALALLADDDGLVAESAAWALGELLGTSDDDDGHDPPDGLTTGASSLMTGVVGALGTAATDHDDPLVREAAAAALGAIGHPDGLAAVLAATQDKPTIRRRAVIALAAFSGQPGVHDALMRALGDRDWQVRQAAAILADEPNSSDDPAP